MANTDIQTGIRNFLFNSNPVPMFLYDGCTGRILQANDAAMARYGYTCTELRNLTIRELSSSDASPASTALDPDAQVRSIATHTTRTGKTFLVEVQQLRFNSAHRNLWLMSAIDKSGFDSERLQLLHSEEMHRSLVEKCPFGIYRLNLATSRFEQANPVLLDALGYTLDELCSVVIRNLYVHPSDRDRFIEKLRSTGSVRNFETKFRKKSGGIIRVSLSGYLCANARTGEQYIQGYVLDVTRQLQLEDLLNHAQRMEAVGRLAGGVAHDFNNITQSISLSCELALQSQLAPALESKLQDIMQQTSRAAEITRQLLAFSRRQVLLPRVVNVNDCVRKNLPMLTRAVGTGVAIQLELSDKDIDDVFIDPEQLTLVMTHLAHNARVAMPNGGTLRVATASRPCPHSPNHCTVLTFSDTGVGMDDATLQRIFEPFFSTKDTPLAAGLGLSTVHGIITQSKGRIECDSRPGKGATFRIYLPIASTASASVPLNKLLNANKSTPRILLVEDDPIVNKHLTYALVEAGLTVDSVSNGEEALSAFDRQSYDILVTDIIMPRIGGVELTKRLRHQVPALPVLLISGYSEESSIVKHFPFDQVAYLQKPFQVTQFISTVHRLLSPSSESEKNELRNFPPPEKEIVEQNRHKF